MLLLLLLLFKERNNINSLEKKTNFPKVGGGHGPRGPPGYATDPPLHDVHGCL